MATIFIVGRAINKGESVKIASVFQTFEGRVLSVKLNFECRCQANFGPNVACRMKKNGLMSCVVITLVTIDDGPWKG